MLPGWLGKASHTTPLLLALLSLRSHDFEADGHYCPRWLTTLCEFFILLCWNSRTGEPGPRQFYVSYVGPNAVGSVVLQAPSVHSEGFFPLIFLCSKHFLSIPDL